MATRVGQVVQHLRQMVQVERVGLAPDADLLQAFATTHADEAFAALPAPHVPPGDVGVRELYAALDEELRRLPENNRQPLLLCYLQGLTQENAARRLGWPRGTLKRRLERGRTLLKARLTRRGMTLGAALVAAGAAGDTLALPPAAPLTGTTLQAAGLLAAGRPVAEKIVSSQVVALAESVVKAMFLARVASLAAAALLAIVCCGMGFAAYSHLGDGPLADGVPTVKPLNERDEQEAQTEPHQAAPGKDRAAATRGHFEAMAAQLEIFQTEEFTVGRGDLANGMARFLPARMTLPWQKVYGQLIASKDDPEDLIDLLKHVNPRVRTLALAALFERENPEFLPSFAAHVGDKHSTVPEIVIVRAFTVFPGEKDKELLPQEIRAQSVGRVARAFLDFWLQPAGYAEKDFASYWAARKDRKFCATWFLARLVRAGQARTPFDARRAPLVRAIRKEIDALPAVDRDWTLLWVAANNYRSVGDGPGRFLATQQELLDAGKRLGPERFMNLIADRPISTDPDLAAKDPRARGSGGLIFWVLRHAGNLLRPEDAPTLLDLEVLRGHRPEYVAAAAELQPANASKWLHAAMDRFQAKGNDYARERATLAAGLWRSVGEGEIGYLADWFYREKVDKNPHSTQTGAFLGAIRGVRAPADRKLVARLISDPRLDRLDYQSLQALVETVNRWTKQAVVGERELRPVWEHGSWGPETPRDDKVVAQWRVKLRASVGDWQ